MPYAIIRTGGHQEKVTPGEHITVDRMKQEVGEEVTFVPLAFSKDDGTLVTDHQELQGTVKVVGKVLQHVKAEKVDIFQYRQKTGYRRHTGHRQPMTLVEIAEIRFGDEVFTAPPPEEKPAEPQPAAQAAPKAEKPKKKSGKKSAKKAAPKAAGPKAGASKKAAPGKKSAKKK
ncbi:MAG: 50S ribosomal protein L21 [Actinomycetota bacterium]